MTQPDTGELEERARQHLAAGVDRHMKTNATGLADALAGQATPSAAELKTRLAQATPQAARHRSDSEVAAMDATAKLVEAYHRAQIGAAVRAKIDAMFERDALAAAILTFAGIFVASQFTPIGWAADITFFFTAVFVSSAVIVAGGHLIRFHRIATNATTDDQLTAAGQEFAAALAEIEVDALLFFVSKVIGSTGGEPPSNIPPSANAVLATRNGQLVLVTAQTIPATVAAQWGILGAGTTSMAMTAGSGGEDKPTGRSGGDEPGAPKRRIPGKPREEFTRKGLRFRINATDEEWAKLESLPGGWAVYVIKDEDTVIYVGVTRRTWERFGEHLANQPGEFLGQVTTVEFQAAGLEERVALAREQELIEQHRPQFNRDQAPFNKRFPTVELTDELRSEALQSSNIRILLYIEQLL